MSELKDLKDNIVLLKDDYERRLKTASTIKKEMSEKGLTDTDKYKRVTTKAACYRVMVTNLNNLL